MKTAINILIGMVIMYVIIYFYGKAMLAGYSVGSTSDTSENTATQVKSSTTLEELMKKGYTESEANQVLAALKNGTINPR